MSKIGKLPVELPETVKATLKDGLLEVAGPKGTLSFKILPVVSVEIKDNKIQVSLKKVTKTSKAIFGTTRALIANIVKGVVNGWSKQLELVGTGFRAEVSGDTLSLTVGFSHPIKIQAPQGITFKVEKNIITVEGYDKELV